MDAHVAIERAGEVVAHGACCRLSAGTFGLGLATERADAWVNGGSPTTGYLNFATEGKTFHNFFASLAGPAADWLFMAGLLAIGVALTLGIGMRSPPFPARCS